MRLRLWVLSLAGLNTALVLLLYLFPQDIHSMYFALSVGTSAIFAVLAMLLILSKESWKGRWLTVLVVAGIIFRLSALFIDPVASDDIYRYIWDGKMQAAGINPYLYAPANSAVAAYHTDMLPGKINFPEMKTIYPPFTQWVFHLSYILGGESVLAFKILLFFAEVLTLFLLLSVLRHSNVPMAMVGLYALCPLPVFQFMIDGHMDALVFPLLLAFILLWQKRQRTTAMVALGLSMLVKLISGMFVPLIFRDSRKRSLYALTLIPFAILLLGYLPYIGGGAAPFESLGIYSTNWTFNGSVHAIIQAVARDNQLARMITSAMLMVWILFIAWKGESLSQRIYWVAVGFILLTPTVHPWYIAWVALLLPLHFRLSGLALVVLSSISNIVGASFQAFGIWNEPPWLAYIQYLPVYILLVLDLLKYGINGSYLETTATVTNQTSSA